jgi:nucleoside recognition membrane protein YjiH
MTLKVLIIGVVLQAMFACFQFMAVIFAGGAAANSDNLKPWQITALDLSIIYIPSISVVIAVLLIFLYLFDSEYLSNWWHAVPVVSLVAYIVFVFSLGGK